MNKRTGYCETQLAVGDTRCTLKCTLVHDCTTLDYILCNYTSKTKLIERKIIFIFSRKSNSKDRVVLLFVRLSVHPFVTLWEGFIQNKNKFKKLNIDASEILK